MAIPPQLCWRGCWSRKIDIAFHMTWILSAIILHKQSATLVLQQQKLTLKAARSMSSRLRVGAFSDIAGENLNPGYQVSPLIVEKYLVGERKEPPIKETSCQNQPKLLRNNAVALRIANTSQIWRELPQTHPSWLAHVNSSPELLPAVVLHKCLWLDLTKTHSASN